MTLQTSADEPTQTKRHSRFAVGRAGLCALLATASCVDAVSVVSDGRSSADVKVAQLAEALAARFTSPERSGRYESARRPPVRGSLTPSRVCADPRRWQCFVPALGRGSVADIHDRLADPPRWWAGHDDDQPDARHSW